MTSRRRFALGILASVVLLPSVSLAQRGATPAPKPSATAPPSTTNIADTRAIRRDIPLTNMIRRGFASGTRDSSGRPGKNYWQLWMDYTINARLDPPTFTLTGSETIVLHNNSPDSLTSIRMRLDQNIFRPTALRQSAPSENTDGFVITKLVVNGQTVDLAAAGGGRGRGGGGGAAAGPATTTVGGFNTTSGTINLASAIPSKGTATLEIEWHHRIAGGTGGNGHRMNNRWGDTLFQVTQWYPRVAVYDDVRQGGWDTDPYLGPAEFYNNFGHFDVHLDVPGGWLVGATGVLQNPNEVLTATARQRLSNVLESDSTRTIVGPDELGPGKATADAPRLVYHFVADTANDFAWGTAEHFVWQATRATIPGRGPIPVNMFYLPGHAAMYAQGGAILRHALQYYSSLWIPDPFPVHNMLDGPDNGMEYPMLVMSNDSPADHETGHQWWPMTVGTNETWYGFMDEGFNQYMNILSASDAAGRNPNVSALGLPDLDGRGQSYGNTSGNEQEAPLMWDNNYGGPMYSFQAYSKTPLMLSMLGGIVSDTAVQRAMSEYAKAWRFKHPTPWDYAFFMSNALHRDLGWFWYYWLFTTESVEGSIAQVSTPGCGAASSAACKTTVTVREDGQMPSPVVLQVKFAATGAPIRPMANAKMTDSVTAVVTYPVDVWFWGSRLFKASLDFGRRPIVKITLDPGGRFPDRNVADNVWPKDSAAAVPARGRGRGRGGL